jgi:hypothetical protein
MTDFNQILIVFRKISVEVRKPFHCEPRLIHVDRRTDVSIQTRISTQKGETAVLDWLIQLDFVPTVGTVLKPQTERTPNTCREYDESL